MKQVLVLATLIAAVSCGNWVGGLRARFDANILFGYGSSSFYDLPKSVSKAVELGWKLETRPEGHLPSLVMYCPSPPVLCCLYDDTEYIAGLNIALSHEIFTNKPLDMDVSGFTDWVASDGKTYHAIQEFFVSEEFLATDKEARLASRKSDKMLQLESIWLVGINRELLEVPATTAGIKNSDFTEQACIPLMGLHYYYKMSAETECKSETILPWFPMYDDGVLTGVGFMTFGTMATAKGDRDWFEKPDEAAVKMIVKNGPQCLYDLAANYGALTMHTYFVENPRMILCLNN